MSSELSSRGSRVPKVSVIVPCYNYGRFLKKCLYSILHQSMEDFEIIVINDGSTDETAEVLEQFIRNPKIKIIHHAQNMGHPKPINEGAKLAKGKYITTIHSDDYLVNKDALGILSNVLDTHPGVGFVHSAHYFINITNNYKFLYRPFKRDRIVRGRSAFLRLIMNTYGVADCAVMIRKEYYQKVGGRDEKIINCNDWDLWLRLASRWDIGYISSILGVMQLHGKNIQVEFVCSGRAYKEGLYILDKVFNEFDLTEEEKKLNNKAYALLHLWQGFNVYTTSSTQFREYFYKAVKLYYPLIFRPGAIFTYCKSLLGDPILYNVRNLKKKLL